MRVAILDGEPLSDLNTRLGTAATPGNYVREVASLGRVAGRPRAVALWNFVAADGSIAFRLSAADYQEFHRHGLLRTA